MHRLRFVTITGADNSIDPAELVKLSIEFPFVEWAILYSQKRNGTFRFPTMQWFTDLSKAIAYNDVNLSLHLCGYYVRNFLKGGDDFAASLPIEIFRLFKRIQINTHGEPHEWNMPDLIANIRPLKSKEFIFQIDGDGKNEAMAKMLVLEHKLPNVSFLLDCSHGAGILPNYWPMPPVSNASTGFAGGLGPDNLAEQIVPIQKAADNDHFKADWWIDMETKVRSFNDQQFDLSKCRIVLETAKPWFEGHE
jgi:hypothetical protein